MFLSVYLSTTFSRRIYRVRYLKSLSDQGNGGPTRIHSLRSTGLRYQLSGLSIDLRQIAYQGCKQRRAGGDPPNEAEASLQGSSLRKMLWFCIWSSIYFRRIFNVGLLLGFYNRSGLISGKVKTTRPQGVL